MSNGSDLISWMDDPAPGVTVGGENPRKFVFDRALWEAAPSSLQAGAALAYQQLGRSGEFGPWWLGKCGGETTVARRFRLRMPPSEWERPWEGFIGAIDREFRPYVSIVRQTEDDSDPHHATELDAPMQVLCLHGADSGPNLGVLDLDGEFKALRSAYEGLDLAARGSIAEPRAAKVDQANLKSLILEHSPSVLWYSGHASADPPGLLLNDGYWLTPEELAAALQTSALVENQCAAAMASMSSGFRAVSHDRASSGLPLLSKMDQAASMMTSAGSASCCSFTISKIFRNAELRR
jgi:hypothetical protein